MTDPPSIERLLLVVALGFFLGLAFEEFHTQGHEKQPGGIRSFPLLALAGALLYFLDPVRLLPMCVGLLSLSLWLGIFYWRHLAEPDAGARPNAGLMVPLCNWIAFLLGPIALAGPPWAAIGMTVAAVLFLTARDTLHGFARRVELGEIVNAGRFLLLTGFILPLVPNTPVTTLTAITPYQVWLAVVAVCAMSYASYLMQRFVAPASSGLLTAVLGGLYSSTATTVVLARRARAEASPTRQTETGIILATTIMYARLLVVIAVFNPGLALLAAPFLGGLCLAGIALAVTCHWLTPAPPAGVTVAPGLANPLELGAAALFAALFVVVSIASSWSAAHFGAAGTYVLALIVGASDIDPFVLSLAQNGAGKISGVTAVVAILLATSSNNLLKAVYVVLYSGGRLLVAPVGALCLLAAGGGGAALWLISR